MHPLQPLVRGARIGLTALARKLHEVAVFRKGRWRTTGLGQYEARLRKGLQRTERYREQSQQRSNRRPRP